jgi:hypothetical protein
VAERRRDQLRFVAKAGRKQWPDWSVDQPGGEDLFLRRAAFSFEEATRNLTGREGLFLVVDGEREEIDTLSWLPLRNRGAQYGRLAIGDEDRPIRLPTDAPGLQDQLATAPLDFLATNIEHSHSFLSLPSQCPLGGDAVDDVRANAQPIATAPPAPAVPCVTTPVNTSRAR